MQFYTWENTSIYIIIFNSHSTPEIKSIIPILQVMKFKDVLRGLPKFIQLVPAELEAELKKFDL